MTEIAGAPISLCHYLVSCTDMDRPIHFVAIHVTMRCLHIYGAYIIIRPGRERMGGNQRSPNIVAGMGGPQETVRPPPFRASFYFWLWMYVALSHDTACATGVVPGASGAFRINWRMCQPTIIRPNLISNCSNITLQSY